MIKVLDEVGRTNLVGKTKAQSKDRYRKRLDYRVNSYNGIDAEKLLDEDLLVTQVQVGDYYCTIAYNNVLKNLIKIVSRQPKHNVTLQSVIRAVTQSIDDTDIFVDCSCPDFCLSGDTKIRLYNGEVRTIEELLDMYNNGHEIHVYSLDTDDNLYKNGLVTSVWISGYSNDMIKITLSNGNSILTTPSHRYMLDTGEYIEASDISMSTNLMCVSILDGKLFKDIYTIKSIEYIKYDDPIPVYDLTVEKYNNFYVDAGVILHNCYRYAYVATQHGYKYGKPENRPSRITNPNDNKGAMCKHLTMLLANKRWMVKLASIVNDFVKANIEEIREKYKVPEEDFFINVSGRPSRNTGRNTNMTKDYRYGYSSDYSDDLSDNTDDSKTSTRASDEDDIDTSNIEDIDDEDTDNEGES